MIPGADLIPLSALQHYIFCLRQCALIHVEQVRAENWRAAEGRLQHERVEEGTGRYCFPLLCGPL